MVDDLVEIFSLDVDFRTAIRSGDTVRLLIEEHSRGGKFFYRRILAAEVRARQRVLQAVYYPEDDAYYRPDGRSLERLFLSAPVRDARISSAFSHRRLHPVLKSYRPHLGIDYAAPAGTPVRSVGDGVVTWADVKGGNGKMVEIRHNGTYSTYYLHLSRIARHIRVGATVEQGQVIGYVGATGLATGPHLDFRLTKNGSFLNPLENQDIAAPAISHRELPAFQAYARRLMATLDRPGVVAK
jgi:murein DD-endopeptidase MepM/ murein hydrolase activator NlpD